MTARGTSGSWRYFDGEFVRPDEITLPDTTQALNYGTGAFEGIRAYRFGSGAMTMFRVKEHFARLARSCATLQIELSESAEQLAAISNELLERNDLQIDSYVRPIVFKRALRPGTPFGVRLSGVSAQIAISVVPMPSVHGGRNVTLWLSDVRRTPAAAVPSHAKITGNYVNNALAVEEATAHGYDDAMMRTIDDRLSEASTSNVFLVTDQVVRTPDIRCDILPGVTRSAVLRLLEEHLDVRVEEAALTATDLFAADEVFLTGTGVEIAHVTALGSPSHGRRVLARGPITSRLVELYAALVRQEPNQLMANM